jgi:agmatinase
MKTFAGIEREFALLETSNILLQSIPYDGTSTWGKGADRGFDAFMDAAENMELYDIQTASEVYKQGIHLLEEMKGFSSPEEMFEAVYRRTQELLLMDKFLTFFGGEHSISIGVIKAFYEYFDEFTVVQIDAHADLRPSYGGSPFNHACAVYDASKNTHLIQVGIRSMDVEEIDHMDEFNTYFAHEMFGHKEWMDESIHKMNKNVYITFDLDAFDPSIMPATGTPEPGGLMWDTTIEYLEKIFSKKNVVGFDIVELAPIPGFKAPQFLAAKLYYKMLSFKFQ